MTDHPFLALVAEALNLMHPRFAAAHGRTYTAGEADEPPAARKVKERSFLLEFYHEFRRLWDSAAPVRLGLAHVVVQGEPDAGPRQPDLLFWQLGEHGTPDRRLAALSLVFASNPSAVAADQTLLARFRVERGYPVAVCVVIGTEEEWATVPPAEGLHVVRFNTDRWTTVLPSK